MLGALISKFQDFDRCEDAAQEALEAALTQWPDQGVPTNPRGWLIRVAARKVIDRSRQSQSRAAREHLSGRRERLDVAGMAPAPCEDADCTLEMLLLCCHPCLSPQTQVILSLRAVLGLTTEQIADVFLVSAATVGQRISRAKATIRKDGRIPAPTDLSERLSAVLSTLYLMFTQGHTLSRGEELLDSSLSSEAIRLTNELRRAVPSDPETAGLLALMLITEARSAARTDKAGDLVPLRQQDRLLWDQTAIREGILLLEWALPHGATGPYQLQAAISAVHGEALTWESTDWPQILVLYRMLEQVAPSPTVRLNRAVAEAMALGPAHALKGLDALGPREKQRYGHRLTAARAHMLEQLGHVREARDAYLDASAQCRSGPERRYLAHQGRRLSGLRDVPRQC